MPFDIIRRNDRFCVVKEGTTDVLGCHETRQEAIDQIIAIESNERERESDSIEPDTFDEFEEKVLQEENPGERPETPSEDSTEHFQWQGVITFEGRPTGDGRMFQSGAVTWNEELLPFPFQWQRVSDSGHDSSVTIGRLDGITRGDNGAIVGSGVIFRGGSAPPEAQEYVNLLAEGAAGGVSIDGDSAEFEITEVGGVQTMLFSSINIRALTAVSVPAFEAARIELVKHVPKEDEDELEPPMLASSGEFELRRDIPSRLSTYDIESMVASGIPVDPPAIWFEDPEFKVLTPITITDDGRVFGHLAGKDTCHIGFGSCKTAPRNCDYDKFFHLGSLKTEEGDTIAVGHMTFRGGHAPLNLGAQGAAAFYDSTSTVSADIRAGEDEFGTWVAGALRPGLSDEEVREIRSAPLSGDWRSIGGKLQLIAAHGVNVPGFPVERPATAQVMVASGESQSMIITECGECSTEDQFNQLIFEMDLADVEE